MTVPRFFPLVVFTVGMSFTTVAFAQKPSPEEQKSQIRAGLKSADVDARRTAIRSLTHNHIARELFPELQAALIDPDGEVRTWAATVTGSECSTETGAV